MKKKREMKIGDLVWAKKEEDDEASSTRYWPGLVQRFTDSHSVMVSFFDRQNPSFFSPSDLRPFADDFSRSLSPPGLHRDHDELLDSGLRCLCQRTALSLSCRCMFRSETAVLGCQVEAEEEKKAFSAEAVVEFVRSKAVLPWVEVGDFVEAVKSVARVQVFRDYNAIGQRSAYRKRRRRSERGMCSVDSQPYLSPDSMVVEQCNLDLDSGNRTSHKKLKMNFTANSPIGMNPKIGLLSKDLLHPSQEDKFEKLSTEAEECKELSVYEMLVNLRILALDSSSVEEKCLSSTAKTCLMFRNSLFEKESNVNSMKCSPLKSQEDFKAQNRVEDNEEKREGEVCGTIVPYVERTLRSSTEAEKCEEQTVDDMLVNLRYLALDSFCLGANSLTATVKTFLRLRACLFDKRLDIMYVRKCSPLKTRQPCFSHFDRFKAQNRVEGNENTPVGAVCDSIVPYVERHVRRLESKRRLILPDVSAPAFKLRKAIPFFSFNRAGYDLPINRTEAEESLSSTLSGIESILKMIETSGKNTSIGNFFSTSKSKNEKFSAQISASACNDVLEFSSNTPDFSLCKELDSLSNNAEVAGGDREFRKKDMDVSYVKLQGVSLTISKDPEPCISYVYRDIEYAKFEDQNEDIQGDSIYCQVRPLTTELTLCEEHGICEANASSGVKVDDIAPTEIYAPEFRQVQDQAHTRLNSDGKAISLVSLNEASENRIKEIEKLNKVDPGNFSGSKSLHMKFPRDVNLPSKEELVKKFLRFGPIDTSETKVSWFTGSAKVVFFKQLDAVAAYQYARTKKVLGGQPNVRYWLDRFEGTRGTAKSSTVKPTVPGLRSCLRNSGSLGTKDKAKYQKVRFLMET